MEKLVVVVHQYMACPGSGQDYSSAWVRSLSSGRRSVSGHTGRARAAGHAASISGSDGSFPFLFLLLVWYTLAPYLS